MCDGEESPMCVQVCRPGALTYMEREKEREEEPTLGEVETGLLTLVNRHGLQNVMDSVTRISKKS
jgi:benzoyl-CoA reductase subunit BamC